MNVDFLIFEILKQVHERKKYKLLFKLLGDSENPCNIPHPDIRLQDLNPLKSL